MEQIGYLKNGRVVFIGVDVGQALLVFFEGVSIAGIAKETWIKRNWTIQFPLVLAYTVISHKSQR